MIPSRWLLWVDCGAGLLVGVLIVALSGWLSDLYRLPHGVVLGIGTANLLYGCFSLFLATRARRSRSQVAFLAAANAAWAVLCGIGLITFWSSASVFGLSQLVLEGLFVGWLAQIEWAQIDSLAVPT